MQKHAVYGNKYTRKTLSTGIIHEFVGNYLH